MIVLKKCTLGAALLTLCYVNDLGAVDLSSGKVFRTTDEQAVIKIISSDELELTSEKGGPHWVCKYSAQGDSIRVVATILGSPQALYFKIVPEGLRPTDGSTLYDEQHFEAASREAKLKAEEKLKAETNQRQQLTPSTPTSPIQKVPTREVGTLREFIGAAVSAPAPDYPYEARSRHIVGSGVVILRIDVSSGSVTDALIKQSIGNPILDNAALSAFRRWRFRPGSTPPKIIAPITFSTTGPSY